MVQPLLDLVLGNTMHSDEVVFYGPWVQSLAIALLAKQHMVVPRTHMLQHDVVELVVLALLLLLWHVLWVTCLKVLLFKSLTHNE